MAIGQRLFQALLTLYVVITASFAIIRLMPGGPMHYLQAQYMAQFEEGSGSMNTRQINALVEAHINVQPDEPIHIQYIDYMGSILMGDFGHSIWYDISVAELIAKAAPWTVFLYSISLAITFAIGIFLGAITAYSEGSKSDVSLSLLGMLTNSIPYYVVGVLAVYVLGYLQGWFPTGGEMTPGTTPGVNWPFISGVLYHASLPGLSIILTGFGGWLLRMRANSIQILGEDYLRVAELRGLSSTRIATQYVGKNAILPLYTQLAISIGFIFGGSVILEEIFAYHGLGFYMFRSVMSRDYPLMMGMFILITAAVVTAIFVADLTYHWVDPRAQSEGNETY